MLTSEQNAAIKADILANPDLNAIPNTQDGAFAIADLYKQVVVPSFFIWRPEGQLVAEIMSNGFDWVRVDNLTVGRARIWDYMRDIGTINGSKANQRAGVLAAFNQAADLAMRLAIFGHLQRPATRIEKLFATGAGTTTTDQAVGPATTTWTVGAPSYSDIFNARNS